MGFTDHPDKNLTYYIGPLSMKHGPVSFPDWKNALARAAISAPLRTTYQREILSFLRHCKASRTAAAVAVIRR